MGRRIGLYIDFFIGINMYKRMLTNVIFLFVLLNGSDLICVNAPKIEEESEQAKKNNEHELRKTREQKNKKRAVWIAGLGAAGLIPVAVLGIYLSRDMSVKQPVHENPVCNPVCSADTLRKYCVDPQVVQLKLDFNIQCSFKQSYSYEVPSNVKVELRSAVLFEEKIAIDWARADGSADFWRCIATTLIKKNPNILLGRYAAENPELVKKITDATSSIPASEKYVFGVDLDQTYYLIRDSEDIQLRTFKFILVNECGFFRKSYELDSEQTPLIAKQLRWMVAYDHFEVAGYILEKMIDRNGLKSYFSMRKNMFNKLKEDIAFKSALPVMLERFYKNSPNYFASIAADQELDDAARLQLVQSLTELLASH